MSLLHEKTSTATFNHVMVLLLSFEITSFISFRVINHKLTHPNIKCPSSEIVVSYPKVTTFNKPTLIRSHGFVLSKAKSV